MREIKEIDEKNEPGGRSKRSVLHEDLVARCYANDCCGLAGTLGDAWQRYKNWLCGDDEYDQVYRRVEERLDRTIARKRETDPEVRSFVEDAEWA